MPSLNNIRIKPKLISLFLLVGLVPMILITWFALNKAEQALEQTSFNQLSAVRDIKKSQIEDYFRTIENNIDTRKTLGYQYSHFRSWCYIQWPRELFSA